MNYVNDEVSLSQTSSHNLVPDIDTEELIANESIDHAVIEADKKCEPVFYNALALEHIDYDVSSSISDKEYLAKLYRIASDGYKDFTRSEKALGIYNMRQRVNSDGPDSI